MPVEEPRVASVTGGGRPQPELANTSNTAVRVMNVRHGHHGVAIRNIPCVMNPELRQGDEPARYISRMLAARGILLGHPLEVRIP